MAGALPYEWTWAREAVWWLRVWQVRAFGWAGVTSKFVEHKPQRCGGLLCYERQAALPRADCTPRAAREQRSLPRIF